MPNKRRLGFYFWNDERYSFRFLNLTCYRDLRKVFVMSRTASVAAINMNGVAVPGADPFVCRLCAPVGVLHQRLQRREIGSALDWHLHRVGELAEILEDGGVGDVIIDASDRPLRDIATEILEAADWLPR